MRLFKIDNFDSDKLIGTTVRKRPVEIVLDLLNFGGQEINKDVSAAWNTSTFVQMIL